MLDLSKYLWLDPSVIVDESLTSKNKELKRFLDQLDKKDYSFAKKNILASFCIKQMHEYASQGRLDDFVFDQSIGKMARSFSKKEAFKKYLQEMLQNDHTKFVMTGMMIVMTGTLLCVFLRAVLVQKFLINFSIDAIVGAIAILFLYRNMKSKYRMVKRYTTPKEYLMLDIASLVLCLMLKLMLPAWIDISLIILFVSYYIQKKKFDRLLKDFHM